MKLSFVFLCVLLLQISAEGFNQEIKLSMQMEDVPVKEVFKKIENMTSYRFVFNDDIIRHLKQVSIDARDKEIGSILKEILEGSGIEYRVLDDKLIVLAPSSHLIKQGTKVTGTVTDANGTSLPGVNITEVGTTNGAITDNEGNYSITVGSDDAVLRFSFVGFLTEEIAVGGQTSINVTLIEDIQALDEVIVIGYGSVKKANLTGAVGTASAERLENRPITSVGQGLQGVIPNLNIEIRNGDPTTSADFNVRGFESINGGRPLILVDGVPMDIESVNPNDIKSVNVLKDAAAAAIYGARAAFGVILIETKEGKTGGLKVTLGTEQSLAQPIYTHDPVTDPYEHVTFRNIIVDRTFGRVGYDEDFVEGTKRYSENPTLENAWEVVDGELRFYGNSNYQERLFADFAPQNKYDVSVSGATEKASYYISFGYLNKDGYLKNKDWNFNYKRYNTSVDLTFELFDWLSIDEKIAFTSQNNDEPFEYKRSAYLNSAGRAFPVLPIEFPDLPYYIEPGDRDQYEDYIGMYIKSGFNWFPYLDGGGRSKFTVNDTWFTQGVTLTPLKGLKIRGDFSANTYWRESEDARTKVEMLNDLNLNSLRITNHFSSDDWIENQTNRNNYYIFNSYAEYEMDQIDGHYIKAMVGFNQEWGIDRMTRARARNLLLPDIRALDATFGDQETRGTKRHVALRGVFYRLNYIYNDKYLVELNGRYDGTSRFPKDSRFGFFPSASAAWRLSNESFMDGIGWLDDLKLRLSYGTLGNQLVGYYPYIPTMGAGTTGFVFSSGPIPYVSPAGLVSPNLTWEKVTTQNVGLDLAILNQKLQASFDYYIRDTKDMLLQVGYPDVLGTDAPEENGADLRTQGWELSMTWRSQFGRDWRYGINFALSDNQSEITKYQNPTGNFNDYYVGKKIGEIWGFETVGIFQNDEDVTNAPDQSQLGQNWRAGDIQYADLDGDGKITRGSQTLDDPGDLTIIGNSSPRYSFGINPDLSYRNWTLNIFFQGLFRDYLPDNGSHNPFYPGNTFYAEKWFLEESWSEDNRDAYFPHPHAAWNDKKNYQPQSRYVQNAAYIRLKNLTLNYNLPQELINRMGLSRVQVYFSGMNLWEYSKIHHSLDPEHVYTTDLEYFRQRIYTLGGKITF